MRSIRPRYFLIACFCFALAGIQTASTVWFRTALAKRYTAGGQYARAIKTYDKILRKERVKNRSRTAAIAETYFKKGCLAGKIGLPDLAIESYALGSAEYADIDPGKYENKNTPSEGRLLAIGLLEGGRFGKAAREFQKLKSAHYRFEDPEKYIAASENLEKKGVNRNDSNFLFSIGDAYIENRLFDEARGFFTKRILDYGAAPLDVLEYLKRRYASDTGIKRKVWGDDIFVVLEDFEKIEPQLGRWLGGAHGKINDHRISEEAAYKGNRSEFLDLTYTKKEYDFWEKNICIPLAEANPNVGLRVYIKSDHPEAQYIGYESVCPNDSTSGIHGSDARRDMPGGWAEHRVDNLYGNAATAAAAPSRNWDTRGMYAGKALLLNNKGVSNKSYIDNIELYLVN